MWLLLKIIFFPITLLVFVASSMVSTINDISDSATLDYDIRKQRDFYAQGGSIEHAIRKSERGF